MNEIADFLRARYADRRVIACACLAEVGETRAGDPYPDGSGVAESDDFPSYPWGIGEAELAYLQQQHPREVIVDLDAKLALVDDLLAEGHQTVDDEWYTCPAVVDQQLGFESGRSGPCSCGRNRRVNRRLAILAQPFAGHPDHKGEEWAP